MDVKRTKRHGTARSPEGQVGSTNDNSVSVRDCINGLSYTVSYILSLRTRDVHDLTGAIDRSRHNGQIDNAGMQTTMFNRTHQVWWSILTNLHPWISEYCSVKNVKPVIHRRVTWPDSAINRSSPNPTFPAKMFTDRFYFGWVLILFTGNERLMCTSQSTWLQIRRRNSKNTAPPGHSFIISVYNVGGR